MMEPRRYVNKLGRVLFVSDGLARGERWMTFWRKPNGSLKRFVSPALPECVSRETAQRDLDAFAKAKGLREAK